LGVLTWIGGYYYFIPRQKRRIKFTNICQSMLKLKTHSLNKQKYKTVVPTVPKSNRKIVERGKIDIPDLFTFLVWYRHFKKRG
jgi:hypothetical protein